jgi:hypothetical protein
MARRAERGSAARQGGREAARPMRGASKNALSVCTASQKWKCHPTKSAIQFPFKQKGRCSVLGDTRHVNPGLNQNKHGGPCAAVTFLDELCTMVAISLLILLADVAHQPCRPLKHGRVKRPRRLMATSARRAAIAASQFGKSFRRESEQSRCKFSCLNVDVFLLFDVSAGSACQMINRCCHTVTGSCTHRTNSAPMTWRLCCEFMINC